MTYFLEGDISLAMARVIPYLRRKFYQMAGELGMTLAMAAVFYSASTLRNAFERAANPDAPIIVPRFES